MEDVSITSVSVIIDWALAAFASVELSSYNNVFVTKLAKYNNYLWLYGHDLCRKICFIKLLLTLVFVDT